MQDILGFAPFLALAASVVALWLPRLPRAWAYCVGASLILAVATGLVSATGVALLGATAACLYFLARAEAAAMRLTQLALLGAAAVLAVGIATGALPGFERLTWYRELRLTPAAAPFALTLNYGKAAVGVLILGFAVARIREARAWRALLRPVAAAALVTAVAVAALAMVTGHTHFEPKWTALFLPWAAVNLLFVCVAEEAFFRGLVQERCARWLAPLRHGRVWAWLTAAALFGLAHAGGGAEWALLAGVAGLGYGWVYMKTGRVEAAVAVHFLVNGTHFLLLTYPRLA